MPIGVGGIGGLGAIIVIVVGLVLGVDTNTLLALLSDDQAPPQQTDTQPVRKRLRRGVFRSSPICKPPSTVTAMNTTAILSPSSGPSPHATSSQSSHGCLYLPSESVH
jgi:hypothetical protein